MTTRTDHPEGLDPSPAGPPGKALLLPPTPLGVDVGSIDGPSDWMNNRGLLGPKVLDGRVLLRQEESPAHARLGIVVGLVGVAVGAEVDGVRRHEPSFGRASREREDGGGG